MISVIVPVYNIEDFLPKCIDSILSQTLTDFELILIDDGSTDRSGIICDEYSKKDSRIIVHHKENGGLSDARNAGISLAKGDYFSFIDSDDWIEKNMLDEMYNTAIKKNADIVTSGYFDVDLDGQLTEVLYFNDDQEWSGKEATKLILLDKEINSFAWNKIYRSDLFLHIRYPKERIFEDIATTYKLFHLSKKVVHINKAYYHYVRRQSSICLVPDISKQIKRKYHTFLGFYERYEYIKNINDFFDIRDELEEKFYNLGIQLLHFVVKFNKKSDSENLYQNVYSILDSTDLISNKHAGLKLKIESLVLKFGTKVFTKVLELKYHKYLQAEI